MSNLQQSVDHLVLTRAQHHTRCTFGVVESIVANRSTGHRILGTYPPAYFIIVQCLTSVSSPCLDDKGSLWTLSISAIPLFRCFSASSKVGSIAGILKIRDEPLGVRNVVATLGMEVVLAIKIVVGY